MNMQENAIIRTQDLITLCYMIDGYEKFKTDFLNLIRSMGYNKCTTIMKRLGKISKGEYVINSKKIKTFYNENKIAIDTINKYCNIYMFIHGNFDDIDKSTINSDNLDYFYQYISNHKDKLNQILALLNKILELGFNQFEFNEGIDFTNIQYQIDSLAFDIPDNGYSTFTYLDNMEVIPQYDPYTIKYRTTDSNYKINIKYHSKISSLVVNDLLFSPERLPADVEHTTLARQILKLNNTQKESYTAIKNSVDLGICSDNLSKQVNTADSMITKLDDDALRDKSLKILQKMKEYVEELRTISVEYNKNVSEIYPSLTTELLEKEKEQYQKRRGISAYIDLD